MEVVHAGWHRRRAGRTELVERIGEIVDDVRGHPEHEVLEDGRVLAVDPLEHATPGIADGLAGRRVVEGLEVEASEVSASATTQAGSS